MNTIIKRTAIVIALLGGLGMTSGCASTSMQSQLDEARQMAQKASQDAAAAMSAAREASSTAADARSMAASAKQAADAARAAAGSAQSCCTANTERMERMFKKSMSK